MKIINSFEELNLIKENIVCTIGVFDGIHKGHKKLILSIKKAAKKQGAVTMVITFDKHPKTILDPLKMPELILSNDIKFIELDSMGVDYLFLLPGTNDFLYMSPIEFIDNLLKSTISKIFIGQNFTFGKNASGNVALLKQSVNNIEIIEQDLLKDNDGNVISSTSIREAIKLGKLKKANEMLSKRYYFVGEVVYGDQRGRTLGFPTANFVMKKNIVCPKDGVYITRIKIDNKWYNSISNVGNNPTFENQAHRVEVHILDFDENIYGKIATVEFIDFIRPEIQFNSLEALIRQMNKDCSYAKEFFLQYGY